MTSDTSTGTRVAAAVAALLVAAGVAWLLHRGLFHSHAQSYDTLLYARSLWGLAHGLPENSVVGVHALAIHGHFVLYLLAPLAWVLPSALVLILAQAASLAAVVAMVAINGARGWGAKGPHMAVALALAITWGSPLVFNPFLFDARPELIGVALATAGLIRAYRRGHVDGGAAAWLMTSLLVREEMALVIAPAMLLLPRPTPGGLAARTRWLLAGVSVAYALAYFLIVRRALGGDLAVSRLAGTQAQFFGAPTLALLPYKAELIFVTLASAGGLAALGWRWSVPAWPGLALLLVSTRMPEHLLNFHYSLFAAPGLCVATVAGCQRLRGMSPRWRMMVLPLVVGVGILSSAAPGARRFKPEFYDPQTVGDAHSLLAVVPPGAGLVVPYPVAARYADRDLILDTRGLLHILRQTAPPRDLAWVLIHESHWQDFGRGLVERRGFLPVDIAGEFALIGRGLPPEAVDRIAKAKTEGCAPAVTWPEAGLELCSLGHHADGRITAVVRRVAPPANRFAGWHLHLHVTATGEEWELMTLDGLLNARDIPVGRAARMMGARRAGPLSGLRLDARLGEHRRSEQVITVPMVGTPPAP